MNKVLEFAKRLRAISVIGLTYANNEYDKERYEEVSSISHSLIEQFLQQPVVGYFSQAREYITPKVDIRVVIFNEASELLLVKEASDGLWSLPGGWADVGFSPSEVAVKEAFEETGLTVEPLKVLAILDKRCHPHPPSPDYVYKIFIQCRVVGGSPKKAFDITDQGYFGQGKLPPLSEHRVLREQIKMLFEFIEFPTRQTIID